MHTTQGKLQGQVLSKPNASIFPLFMCLIYFISRLLLLTYSRRWPENSAYITTLPHYIHCLTTWTFISVVYIRFFTLFTVFLHLKLGWNVSVISIRLQKVMDWTVLALSWVREGRRSGCILGHSAPDQEWPTWNFKLTLVDLESYLQSGEGRNEKVSKVHTGEVPELGRPSCACCWGRGWVLHGRAEGVT